MKKIIFVMLLAVSALYVQAQSNPWRQVNLTSASKGRDVFKNHFKPSAYVSFELNEDVMKSQLRKAPSEKNASSATSSLIITVPNSKGQTERFRVVEAPSMEPGLAAKFPDIKSYAGQGIDDPSSRIRFDMSPLGFNAVIMSADRKSFYISPADRLSKSYIVYDRELINSKKYGFDCSLDEAINSEVQKSGFNTGKNANQNKLKTYRLALCLTGEYSRAVLRDVAAGTDTSTTAKKLAIILAVANTNTTAANAVFENDFGLRLQLISNETSIIYLDPATDPFSTWTSTFATTTWNTETQTTCTNVIGNANYDVGHMLNYNTLKNNGNAGCIGCVCVTPSGSTGKGRGWNMYGQYKGNYLIIDYWTHELGHQFGGNHTFTHNIEGSIAQVEPGSGTTIMGYAGITGATDVQLHSDAYFHAITIQQITDNIQTGLSSACGTSTTLINNLPTASAGTDYTVPKSTPFTLTGTSTDADAADVRTYDWEQIDVYGTSTNSNTYPTSTTTKGPVFRSFSPVTGTSRTFPRLQVIVDSSNVGKWEVLPSVARSLNFRFTVRDNHSGGSANESDDMLVTVSGTAGPFAVSSPNTAVKLGAGTTQTITWSVNSTNAAPINCANVKISLSTDGGQTFPTVLAASTANDGTEAIAIPSVSSTTCRIKIEAIGNIFFDISNTNFSIGSCSSMAGLTASNVTGTSAALAWTAAADAVSYDVDYKLASSSTWISAAVATTGTTVNLSSLTPGNIYDFRVKNNCPYGNGTYTTAQLTTLCSVAPSGLAASAVTGSTATVSWTAASGAANYSVDYKLVSSSTWINVATANVSTSFNLSGLTIGAQYDYRVRTNCSSGSSAYTAAQFTTLCGTAPTGLSASSVTGTGATLGWAAVSGAAGYSVDYKLTSSSTWINAATATTATSVNLSGLTIGAQYDFRVGTNCAFGSSAYTSAQFITLCGTAPTGLSASSVAGTTATVSWSAVSGATGYSVDYKLASSSTWINAATATASTSVNLSGLTIGAQYDYRVGTNCAFGSSATTAAQFSTLCNTAPAGLVSSSVTTSSATVSWSAATGATSYDVEYKAASSSTWISAALAATATSVSINGLNYSTQYDWRVKTNCASGSSAYTGAQFTTAIPDCNAPASLDASAVTVSSATISWSAASGAASYDVEYKAASSATWISAAVATSATSVNQWC